MLVPFPKLNQVIEFFKEQPPLLSWAAQVKSFHHQASTQRSEVTPHNKPNPGQLSSSNWRWALSRSILPPASAFRLFLMAFGAAHTHTTGSDTVPTGMSKTGQSDLLTPCRSWWIATHPEHAEVLFPLWWSRECHQTDASECALHSLLFKGASQMYGRMLGGVKSRQGFLGGSLFTPFATLSVEAKVIHLPTIHSEIRICLSPRYENCLVVLSERVTHTQAWTANWGCVLVAKWTPDFFKHKTCLLLSV